MLREAEAGELSDHWHLRVTATGRPLMPSGRPLVPSWKRLSQHDGRRHTQCMGRQCMRGALLFVWNKVYM